MGGGVIMVPALVAFAGFEHRRAASTSLTAVIFPAAAGVITYVAHDHINWPATGLLVAGSVVGAQIRNLSTHSPPGENGAVGVCGIPAHLGGGAGFRGPVARCSD